MLNRKRKLIIIVSVLLVSSFLTTSLTAYYVSLFSLREQIIQSELPLTSDTIYSEIQRDLLLPIFISSLMSNDTFLQDWITDGETNRPQIIKYLTEIQKKYNTVTSFFVSENTRRYYHPNNKDRMVMQENPEDRWYFEVREHPDPYQINVDIDQANNNTVTIFINYKTHDSNGAFIGVTGVGLTIQMVQEMMMSYKHRFDRHVTFIDEYGIIMLSTNPTNKVAENLSNSPGMKAITRNIISENREQLTYQIDGVRYHLNSRYIPEFKWYLLVEQAETNVMEGAFNTLLLNLGICLIITSVVVVITDLTISVYQDNLEVLANTDKLTGLYNRQVFDTHLEQNIYESRRNITPLSLILLDIDHFKTINDNLGHITGDLVLRTIANNLKMRCRSIDILCRWGGEEFVILLKNCRLDEARKIADDIRKHIDNTPISNTGGPINVTISAGIAELKVADTKDSLLNRADQALYHAKKSGRNQVSTHYDATSTPH